MFPWRRMQSHTSDSVQSWMGSQFNTNRPLVGAEQSLRTMTVSFFARIELSSARTPMAQMTLPDGNVFLSQREIGSLFKSDVQYLIDELGQQGRSGLAW